MRGGVVVALGMATGACAALVHLDDSDTDPPTIPAANTKNDAGKSSGQAASSGTSGTATSGDSGADAGADTGTPLVTKCTKQEDCATNDSDHDHCTNRGECTRTCAPENAYCYTACCVGLVCRRSDFGSLDFCLPPK